MKTHPVFNLCRDQSLYFRPLAVFTFKHCLHTSKAVICWGFCNGRYGRPRVDKHQNVNWQCCSQVLNAPKELCLKIEQHSNKTYFLRNVDKGHISKYRVSMICLKISLAAEFTFWEFKERYWMISSRLRW